MSSTVTVNVRSLVLAVGVAMALVVASLLGSGQAGVPLAAAAPPSPADEPSIVMTGTGEATGVPDQLRFSVAVHTTADDVATALASANRSTRDVLSALNRQHIARRDVQTTGMSIDADYDYSDEGPAVITGYSVSQRLSVLVRSLPDAGATIAAVTEAGGNTIRLHDIRLEVGDEDALVRQARDAAIAEAQAKAEQYAAATGRSLGEVVLVREESTGGRYPTPYPQAEAAYAMDVGRVPLRAGSAELEVSVSVVWRLQ
jgi:uncharacterized protein YggE